MSKPKQPWRAESNRVVDGVKIPVYSVALVHCATKEVCTITGILAANPEQAKYHAKDRMSVAAMWDVANCIRLA